MGVAASTRDFVAVTVILCSLVWVNAAEGVNVTERIVMLLEAAWVSLPLLQQLRLTLMLEAKVNVQNNTDSATMELRRSIALLVAKTMQTFCPNFLSFCQREGTRTSY